MPHRRKVCLDCHADNVAQAQRGERFQITDGVGCETCHGGAELWISSHADKGVPHADNLAKGLYPTEDPVKRAELCLSCHMGTPDRMITHRIMGAGHPRLSFELDTFTWINPHYEVDDDYIARKGEFNGVRDWGVGQGVAAATALDTLLDPQHGWNGIFPELVLFDCHACHRRMDGGKWAPRQGTGLGPGVVRLNDANVVMFRHVLSAVDGSAAARVLEQTRILHRATTQSRDATAAAAQRLRDDLRALLPRVAAHDFGADSLAPILDSLVADGERGEFRDFAAAEQAAKAASSVIVAFETAKALRHRPGRGPEGQGRRRLREGRGRRALRHGGVRGELARVAAGGGGVSGGNWGRGIRQAHPERISPTSAASPGSQYPFRVSLSNPTPSARKPRLSWIIAPLFAS